MKKWMILLLMMSLMSPALTMTAMAAEHNFDGVEAGPFGKATSVEEVTIINGPQSEGDNMNRSKDSAYGPPVFGSPSSDTPGTGEPITPNLSGVDSITASYPSGSYTAYGNNIPGDNSYLSSDGTGLSIPANAVSASMYPSPIDSNRPSSSKFTLPDDMFYSDGSIGTLFIPSLSLTVKVFEEESMENMRRGVGHFKSTSCWDGNVAVAGHNRGVADHGKIHTLSIGARIKYTTVYGTRTYEVYSITRISETDTSCLSWSDENMITLITCVSGVSDQRWCVQAREI